MAQLIRTGGQAALTAGGQTILYTVPGGRAFYITYFFALFQTAITAGSCNLQLDGGGGVTTCWLNSQAQEVALTFNRATLAAGTNVLINSANGLTPASPTLNWGLLGYLQ